MREAGINYYKKGAIVSYITIAVNIIASLLYTPWMLAKIGDSNYGLYTLATTLINIFLIDFGFSSAVSRFVAKYNAEGDQEKINNFLGMLYRLYAIIVGLVLVVLVILTNLNGKAIENSLPLAQASN
jgi:O-antigen/teichoic acid export membrane protein